MPTISKELDIDAHIQVNGEPLVEHIGNDSLQDTNAIARYIEATAGSEFEFTYTFTGPNTTNKDIRVSCSIDGNVVRKLVHRHQGCSLWSVHRVNKGVLGMYDDAQVLRPFRFGDIALHGQSFTAAFVGKGSQAKSSIQNTAMLGEVKLEFYFGTAGMRSDQLFLGDLAEPQEMPGKSLEGEATSLCTRLGIPRHHKFPPARDFNHDGNCPFATIIFKYRTRAELQALCIIPRDPKSLPSPPCSQTARQPSKEALPPQMIVKKEPETFPTAARHQHVPNKSYITPPPVPTKPAQSPASRKATAPSSTESSSVRTVLAPRSFAPSPVAFPTPPPTPSQAAAPTLRPPRRDLLSAIKYYRPEKTAGLEGMSDEELEVILEDYRAEWRAKKMSEAQATIGVKREREDEVEWGSNKKHKPTEVVDLT